MNDFKAASWIWTNLTDSGKDLYRLFRKEFMWVQDCSPVLIKISANSTYALFVNGRRCQIQQLADYPDSITFSSSDITQYLHPGKNLIAVEIHYIGTNFSTIQAGTPFLRAVISAESSVYEKTDTSWRWADSRAYHSGLSCKVTEQLGYVFCYDAQREIAWIDPEFDDSGWRNAFEYDASIFSNVAVAERDVPQLIQTTIPSCAISQVGLLRRVTEEATFALSLSHDYLSPRIEEEILLNKKAIPLEECLSTPKRVLLPENKEPYRFRPLSDFPEANGFYIITDLGREMVGYLYFRLSAPEGTVIDIAHGEHLTDGRVRAAIGGRNFADRYICSEGRNEFLFVHRRIGCRYLELHFTGCDAGEIVLEYVGVLPLELPLPDAARFHTEDRLLAKINEVSIDTLKLCMHEHYEDCPWREQALYAYDARNQMLYGYYVWGNYDFAASSLNLLGKSFDGDRYLALTAPGLPEITIPIFTMVWITALWEYQLFSGSSTLFERWQEQIDHILDRALVEKDLTVGGLYHPGASDYIWNFCEWNGELQGYSYLRAPYNIYFHEALASAAKLHEVHGNKKRSTFLLQKAEQLKNVIDQLFWDQDASIYKADYPGSKKEYYEHIQVIMLSEGIVPEEKKEPVLRALQQKELCPVSLSALFYQINGLMECGVDGRRFLTGYMNSTFEPIVFSGATSLWETCNGEADFDGAASLCHAWSSAMPYFCGSRILGVRPLEPGFLTFEIKPYYAGLTHAEGDVPTPYGKIHISWKFNDGKLSVQIRHPKCLNAIVNSWPECPIDTVDLELY